MDRIHRRLSDQATVGYISEAPEKLFRIGKHYAFGLSGHAPVFEVVSQDPRFTSFWTDHYAQHPNWHHYAEYGHLLQYSMVFYAGEGWFGPRATRIP